MQPRNTDPKTRYEIRLDCGHRKTQQYPPLGFRAKIVCSGDHAEGQRSRHWIDYTDTLLDMLTVRTTAA